MEQDQRTCPSCGSPTGDYAFCQSCRSHMDALVGVPIRAASQTTSVAAQADGASDQTSVPRPGRSYRSSPILALQQTPTPSI